MKFRAGFVSNSSSSCYILDLEDYKLLDKFTLDEQEYH